MKVTDHVKLRELILHIAKKSAGDSQFGAVKLNKILFYADFLSRLRRRKSITGEEYFAIKEGPAPQQMKPVTEKMISDQVFAFQLIDVGLPHPKKRPIALRPPDYDKLEAEDIAIADEVIEKFQSKNGKALSNLSHQFAGYIAAYADGEKTLIPHSTVNFDTKGFWGIDLPPIPEDLVSYGKGLAKKLKSKSQPVGA